MEDAPFHSAHFVFVTDDQFAALMRARALDEPIYGWGHGGPCYLRGRVVIHERTLGL